MGLRVVVVSRQAEEAVALLRARRPDVDWVGVADPGGMPVLQADAVVGSQLSADVLARIEGLRWVQGWWAGIDGQTVPEGLLFTRMVGAFTQDMAEHVLGQVLDFVKRFPQARAQQAERRWQRYQPRRLSETRVGIAGGGEIGRGIGRTLASLGVSVSYLVRVPRPLEPGAPVYGPATEAAFWSSVDGVVLVLPLTPDTDGFLDAGRIARLRPGSFVINVGRGRVVDEDALLAGLNTGQVDRAYLDVLGVEPLPPDSPLWSHPRVVITPHVSGAGRLEDLVERSLENLDRYLRGEPLVGVVDRERGY